MKIRRPSPLDLVYVPDELRTLPQWVVFRLSWNEVKAKWAKEPYQARHPEQHASSTEPATWATFDEAAKIVYAEQADQIGFTLTESDPYFGLDLESKLTADEQAEIVAHVDSYTERSVGGGLHIIGRGRLSGSGRHPEKLGVFDRARFFVVTGNVVDGRKTIHDRQAELEAVLARFMPPVAPQPR